MKNFLFLLFLTAFSLKAQLSRYPYIQSTTTNSTIIAWKTTNGALGTIKYGTDSTSLVFTKTENSVTTNHALLLDNLIENTKYYYEVYSGVTFETKEYFYTAKDSTHNDFSFLQYGDCGYNSQIQYEIGALMEADNAEFAVVCGDVDQGGVPHFSASGGGDDYDEIYFDVYNNGDSSKMLSRECHYTAIGNHDYYANNGAEYDNVFYLPHNNNENSERYYSFTWGDAKFICLDVITPYDTTWNFSYPIYNTQDIETRWWTDFRQGSPQYDFLINELQCNDKKWVFVYFHEGPWTNYWGSDYSVSPSLGGDYYEWDGNIMVRDELVPVFEQYGVDFVLCGHSHLYERGEWNGVTYVTSGAAGDTDTPNGTERVDPHWAQLPLSILQNSYAKFQVFDDSVYLKSICKEDTVIDNYSKTKTFTSFNTNPTITNVSCNGGNNGAVSLNIVGPKPPYTIEWFDGDTSSTKTNLSAGTYFAYVNNGFNCEKIISVTIEEPPVLIPQIVSTSGNDQFCEGTTISLLTSDQFAYTSYDWSNGETSAQIYLTDEETVTLTVVSSEGCIGTSAPFTVSYLPEPLATFNYANLDTTYNFLASGTNVSDYNWNFGDGTDTTLNTNLVSHTFNNNSYYTVQLFATNDCGVDTTTINILVGDTTTGIFEIVNSEYIKVFPNPFSENTKIETTNLEGLLSIKLFNSIGKKVLSFKTRKKEFNIKRNRLEEGIYFLNITDKNNRRVVYKLIVK